MSRTAPYSTLGLEALKVVRSGSTPGIVNAATSKMEILADCVPMARYFPVPEKHAAKLPLLIVSNAHNLNHAA